MKTNLVFGVINITIGLAGAVVGILEKNLLLSALGGANVGFGIWFLSHFYDRGCRP